jgi:serine/threonine protein kinase
MNQHESSLLADVGAPKARKVGNEMAPSSLEGQTLGRYRVLEPLGHGGMARVYRAYHPQLDRYVAIKVLRPDLVDEEEFLLRFRREAQSVAALRHANIVQVFDFDLQSDVYYMVMELLEGDTLKTRLNDYRARDRQMEFGEVVRILLDVLDGLAYAHNEGMIHRDIKPANILLTKRGRAVIADFGIARIVGGTRHTMSGALMGTLSYMAPEQGLEGHSDVRSDIYSLGIVLYEMLTQRTPFDADTPLAVLMKHLNDPLPLPRQIEPTVPEPFERIVLKALAKRPEDRYQSAEEMAQALREAAEEVEIELPKRISLPFSFTTMAAPAESVAVLSGTARERISDVQFANGDTDIALSQRLAAERATEGPAIEGVGKEFVDAASALGRLVVGKTAEALRETVKVVEGESPETLPEVGAETAKKQRRNALGKAILTAVGIMVIGNLAALWVAGLTDAWDIFEFGWPIELFLLSLGLCVIMNATGSVWMLIPVIILLGNGILLAYCTLTRNWEHWIFLWPLEVLMIGGSVSWAVWLARQGDSARRTSRLLAWTLGWISVVLATALGVIIALVVLFGYILPLVLLSAVLFYWFVLRPWHLTWGTTDGRIHQSLPGDDLVPQAKMRTTHTVAIKAPAAEVWPWLAQIGHKRAGWYSYDWIHRILGVAGSVDDPYHSATRIIPELQEPQVGDSIEIAPGMGFTITAIESGRTLVLNANMDMNTGDSFDPAETTPEKYLLSSWVWHLEEVDEKTSRLVVRTRQDYNPSLLNTLMIRGLVEPGGFLMERKTLLNIKRRVEATAKRRRKKSGKGLFRRSKNKGGEDG